MLRCVALSKAGVGGVAGARAALPRLSISRSSPAGVTDITELRRGASGSSSSSSNSSGSVPNPDAGVVDDHPLDSCDGEGRVRVTTLSHVIGHDIIEDLGLVVGCSSKANHIGRDVLAILRGALGGEIRGYGDLLTRVTAEATARMQQEALQRGANAVVSARFEAAVKPEAMFGVFLFSQAYGTAVRITPSGYKVPPRASASRA